MICNCFPSSGLRPSVSAEAPPRQDAVTGCHPFHGFQLPFLFLRGVRVYASRCAHLLRPRWPPLRLAWHPGDAAQNKPQGYYLWLGDMLIGQGLPAGEPAEQGIRLEAGKLRLFTLINLRHTTGSYAPE